MKLAIHWYQKSCASQEDWPQLHHVCYWELIWAHQFSQDWWGAHRYATLLFNESKWSRCFYAYQMAVMLCMVLQCCLFLFCLNFLFTFCQLLVYLPTYFFLGAG